MAEEKLIRVSPYMGLQQNHNVKEATLQVLRMEFSSAGPYYMG